MENGNQQGLTLVEILIAVVVLSVGLLGMAGIQLKGLSGNHSASLRSQATLLANDMAERMHANPNTSYDGITGGLNCANVPAAFCTNTSGDNIADTCTPAEMASFDAFIWMCGITDYEGVANLLPSGAATISCNDLDATDAIACTPGSSFDIAVNWDEASKDADDTAAQTKTVVITIVP